TQPADRETTPAGPSPRPAAGLGFGSGLGLVAANMIGSGVFLSAGFMAQQLGPGAILLAWLIGTLIALAGARAYAEVAQLVPRSGGEYRYLSDLLHPVLGTLAGWASLLIGFSAPIAVAALAAGHFMRTLVPAASPYVVATALIVLLTAAHAGGFRLSRRTQDGLVLVKAALLVAFVVVGLAHAPVGWPAWSPPSPPEGSVVPAFVTSLFFVAFAFSGWNAAAYAAGEFARPRQDVPRAMMLGCGLVGTLYMAVNWVFVSSIPPDRASVVLAYESRRVTLGHLVMQDALGPAGGAAMSVLTIVAFISSMSAMTFVGPRVYAAMARDGHLPASLAGTSATPPAASVVLQGALALVLLFTHRLQHVLQNVGGILTLFNALVALSLFRVRFAARPGEPRPSGGSLFAAAVYVVTSTVMLYFGLRAQVQLLAWVLAVMAAAGAFQAWRWASRRR
ncbi:MAG TPA: APC family permease, partial [Vicinamibacteria bacterium]|nr:APC family permease [Vicinamibacteria bacterium]